jgi:hypothetical protein
MKNARRTFGVAGLVVLIAAAAWYRLAPGETPVGQSPLVTIDAAALERVTADFNRYPNETRVIVLLSPT